MAIYPEIAQRLIANKLIPLLISVFLLSNTACADSPSVAQPTTQQEQLPPLETLFASHHKTLRVSTLADGRMVASYLAIDSQPDFLREGLIRNQDVQLTHLIGLTAAICTQWPGGKKPTDFSVRWDLFRTPPHPKHFMGRHHISCALAKEAYAKFGTKLSLPFLVAKNPGYITLQAALPDLKTPEQIVSWQKTLATIPLTTIGKLQPGDQILH